MFFKFYFLIFFTLVGCISCGGSQGLLKSPDCSEEQYVQWVQSFAFCKSYAKEGEVCSPAVRASLTTDTRCEEGLSCTPPNNPNLTITNTPDWTCE